jgi:hypothetical protein
MPRVSKTERQIREAIDALAKIGLDESKADYIRRPALSAIVRHAKEQRKHQREMASLKAERDQENRVYAPSLPPRETGQEYEQRVRRQMGA